MISSLHLSSNSRPDKLEKKVRFYLWSEWQQKCQLIVLLLCSLRMWPWMKECYVWPLWLESTKFWPSLLSNNWSYWLSLQCLYPVSCVVMGHLTHSKKKDSLFMNYSWGLAGWLAPTTCPLSEFVGGAGALPWFIRKILGDDMSAFPLLHNWILFV